MDPRIVFVTDFPVAADRAREMAPSGFELAVVPARSAEYVEATNSQIRPQASRESQIKLGPTPYAAAAQSNPLVGGGVSALPSSLFALLSTARSVRNSPRLLLLNKRSIGSV